MPLNIKVNNSDAEIKIIGKDIVIPLQSVGDTEFLIILPKDKIKTALIPLDIQVFAGEKLIKEIKTSFLAPNK